MVVLEEWHVVVEAPATLPDDVADRVRAAIIVSLEAWAASAEAAVAASHGVAVRIEVPAS